MNSILKSDCGRVVLEVEYDAELLNWDEAIRAGLAAHGLRPGQAAVIATPTPTTRAKNEDAHAQERLAGF